MEEKNCVSRVPPIARISRPGAGKLLGALLSVLLLGVLTPSRARAGVLELSGAFSFYNTDLGDSNYEWTRRWVLGLGYYFWTLSEVEFSVQDVVVRTSIAGFEDTTFHDQIFGLDWVQFFASRQAPVSPFVKVGVGVLDRQASGLYYSIQATPASYSSFTVLLGAGLRVNLTERFGIHGEGITYLLGGSLGTWQNNFSVNFGASVYLF